MAGPWSPCQVRIDHAGPFAAACVPIDQQRIKDSARPRLEQYRRMREDARTKAYPPDIDVDFEKRLRARENQIDKGHNSPEYQKYSNTKDFFKEYSWADIPSPNPMVQVGKREFDHILSAWRRSLHEYADIMGDENAADPTTPARVPQVSIGSSSRSPLGPLFVETPLPPQSDQNQGLGWTPDCPALRQEHMSCQQGEQSKQLQQLHNYQQQQQQNQEPQQQQQQHQHQQQQQQQQQQQYQQQHQFSTYAVWSPQTRQPLCEQQPSLNRLVTGENLEWQQEKVVMLHRAALQPQPQQQQQMQQQQEEPSAAPVALERITTGDIWPWQQCPASSDWPSSGASSDFPSTGEIYEWQQ